jgi:hypothetical protein
LGVYLGKQSWVLPPTASPELGKLEVWWMGIAISFIKLKSSALLWPIVIQPELYHLQQVVP